MGIVNRLNDKRLVALVVGLVLLGIIMRFMGRR